MNCPSPLHSLNWFCLLVSTLTGLAPRSHVCFCFRYNSWATGEGDIHRAEIGEIMRSPSISPDHDYAISAGVVYRRIINYTQYFGVGDPFEDIL